MRGLKLTTTPAGEPVTLADMKAHLRVDLSVEDAYIQALVTTARVYLERLTGYQMVEATYEWSLPSFPGVPMDALEPEWHWAMVAHHRKAALRLPRHPLQQINSIDYTAADGTTQSFTDFQEQADTVPPLVAPAPDKHWPDTRRHDLRAVTISFTAGNAPGGGSPPDYGADVPPPLKHAVTLLAADWFNNRVPKREDGDGSELPPYIKHLIAEYRMW